MVFRTLIFLFIFPFSLYSQFSYEYDQSVAVLHENDTLPNAWAGGINSGQFGTIDLNTDGTPDLVIFDRTSNKANTYLAIDKKYIYQPAYEQQLPADIKNWVLLADYDCDGRKDIFTSSQFGMKVYRNVTETGGALSWELAADPVFTKGSSGKINLQVNSTDIPGITDLDNDGDLDILIYNFAAGGFIEYHKNRSVENNGNCSELVYERVTRQWGKFEECDCNKFAFGQRCVELDGKAEVQEPNRELHAGGKSILPIDIDNDNDKDILVGHEDCTNLYFMENVGTPDEALFTSFQSYFPNEKEAANFYIFPAAYYEDMNFDGKKDLLVAPNAFFNIKDAIDFSHSAWLYPNTGSAKKPEFKLAKKNFLQDEMIDVGENAVPVFTDFDADGDFDMFLGQRGQLQNDEFYGSIILYENVGSPILPVFQLLTTNFLDLSQFKLKDIKIYFADFNGDQQPEMLFSGIPTGTYWKAKLYLAKNNAKSGQPFEYNINKVQELPLSLNFRDNLTFYDINTDGKTDLLIAHQFGNLSYYENKSDNLLPQWILAEKEFKGFKGSPSTRNLSVLIKDLDMNGQPELVSTDYSGVLSILPDFLSAMNNREPGIEIKNENQVIRNTVTGEIVRSQLGEQVWLEGVDLFNDGQPGLIIGNQQGGVHLLRPFNRIPAVERQFIIFPDPTEKTFAVRDRDVEMVRIFNALNQLVIEKKRVAIGNIVINLQKMEPGVYVVKIIRKNETTEKRLILTQPIR